MTLKCILVASDSKWRAADNTRVCFYSCDSLVDCNGIVQSPGFVCLACLLDSFIKFCYGLTGGDLLFFDLCDFYDFVVLTDRDDFNFSLGFFGVCSTG